MTADERAEKARVDCNHLGEGTCIPCVAVAVRAAEEEQDRVLLEHIRFMHIANHPDPDYMQGFNDALGLLAAAIRARGTAP